MSRGLKCKPPRGDSFGRFVFFFSVSFLRVEGVGTEKWGVAEQRGGVALPGERAGIQHPGFAAEGAHHVQIVGDDEQRAVRVLPVCERGEYALFEAPVEADGRLIENQQVGIARQLQGDEDEASVALRKMKGAAVSDGVEIETELSNHERSRAQSRSAPLLQLLAQGVFKEDILGELEDVGDAMALRLRRGVVQEDGARGGLEQPGQQIA